ncbi:nuclear transport factor 2 family protein [Parahaliea aestuarii]|uniref:Nuclear transport factor 2 family protein n=1 Tax=Parahaliea aestuarii TaxID=1852021 RepID=A0A5C8ZW93_9GAMM|nr:nuclear transport factor 2 family protein [Parahaliea aestuarii]TXS91737.1 nuclear transport factor 2 family protein [Parahaliea aestuarii]
MNLDTLLAERAIYRALVQFARAMDERDWNALIALTTEDIGADLGAGTLNGRAALVANMRSFLDDCGPTQHLLGNVLIEVDGERASSRAYVSDMHLGRGERAHLTFSTLGDYHDQWQLQDGQWRMCHRRKLNRAHIGDISVLGSGPADWNR